MANMKANSGEAFVPEELRKEGELSESESIVRQLGQEGAVESIVDESGDVEDVTNLSTEDEGAVEDWRVELEKANEEDLGKGSANDIPDLGQRLNGNTPTV
ncbi:hypothetical protein A3H26_01805 [candidate division WWE3 bacterium RIFCSPLOWO2_12_FULL_36_10]|uniref:Uncharacterized protein n=1 Tax=candidate division WWE3 bacterium RIFCSPLOWO2_12_FULL_36_10 TaxID=1802630 RepID=A0A1F4VIB0_UNCKA|nr:MAG: hypothetical protein A3H26_01805 [candidate division WWE3 bacterium RIFCSPLOWO2_12_FULL_36_10]